MSDLIDRAALREARSYGQGTSGDDFMRPFYWADDIDAAPTIECGDCANYERCPLVQSRIDRGLCSAGFGCADFLRRQP